MLKNKNIKDKDRAVKAIMEYTNNNIVKFTVDIDTLIEKKVKTSKSLSVKKTNTKGMLQRLMDAGYSLIGMGPNEDKNDETKGLTFFQDC